MSRPAVAFERLAIVLAALALSVGLIALLSGFFAGRDQAGVSGSAAGPGQAFADLGHRHLRPGEPHPRYDSIPPTSGPHRPAAVRHDETQLSVDQLLEALELGDVVVFYGDRVPPPDLVALTRSLADPFSPALARAGQAVILGHRPGTRGLVAVAWAHLLHASGPRDPALREFVSFWLGRGATSRCC